LPWKRNNNDPEMNKPMKQSEFPSWIKNKEYTQNFSNGMLIPLILFISALAQEIDRDRVSQIPSQLRK